MSTLISTVPVDPGGFHQRGTGVGVEIQRLRIVGTQTGMQID